MYNYGKILALLCLCVMGHLFAKAAGIYVKVISANDLVVGGTYILAAQRSGTTYVAKEFDSNQLSTVTSGFTVDGNTITVDTATPLEFELGGDAEGYTLNYHSTKYLGYANKSGSTNAAFLEEVDNSADAKEKWTFNINNCELVSSIADRGLRLKNNDVYIRAYPSATEYPIAYLYKKVSSIATINFASACTDGEKYYGTYSNGSAFVVPDDLTVSEIKVIDGKLTVESYATGAVVPANTGVMVSANTAGEHCVVLTGAVGTSVYGDANMLKSSGNGITAVEMADAHTGCRYYRLTMHNGTMLGYYWGAADGAAFSLGANKAYLAVPAVGARLSGFDMTESEVVAMKSPDIESVDGATFNLFGQRVGIATRGIVIRNGKKYYNK